MTPGMPRILLLLAALATACDSSDPDEIREPDATVPAPGIDSCLATCEDKLTVSIAGLVADQTYDLTAATADETITCAIDTSDGLRMDCDTGLFVSSRLDEARIEFPGTPGEVTVTASQGGTELANATLTPAYAPFTICGITCQIAEVVFQL